MNDDELAREARAVMDRWRYGDRGPRTIERLAAVIRRYIDRAEQELARDLGVPYVPRRPSPWCDDDGGPAA